MHACSWYLGSEALGCRTLRLESQCSAGLRMQPYPRSPDLVWPGHLPGTGCLTARAVGTGFPTVGLRLWLVPGCGWSWVLLTPARHGWGLGWVFLGSVCGVVPLLPAVCGVRGWAVVSACFQDVFRFVRISLAPRRFRFRCAVWACVLGPGLGCAPPFLAGLSGCVFSGCWVSSFLGLSLALWSLTPSPFFRAGLLAFFFFCFCLSRCPSSRRAAVPGLVLPVLAGWSPCACLGVLSSVPSGWGVWPPSVLLAGGLVAVGCFRAAPRPPHLFWGGGGRPGCSSLCLSSAGACSVAGVWCGRSLTTPGGGSCVLLPATPGWVSLPVVVGGPRHSWLGSAGGGGVWCVVCGGGVLVGLWLVCGVVGPSPLLAEVPVCYSPPLLAGFRCRWWWAVPATPGWGPLAALLCGVWCVAVVCWWGCGWCVVWLVPRHSWRRFLCATPRHSWLGFAAGGGGRSPPLLAGVRLRRWCVVCGVWCVVCGGGVLAGLWLVCGVVGPSQLLAEVPVCYSPPPLAGFRCLWWWAVPYTPGWGPLAAVVCGVWCVVCGGGVLWGCGWCVVWLVPRHSWRRSLCATPRHSWLGFAAGGGERSPPLLAGVRWRRLCVVCGVSCVMCGGGVLLGLWLVCGVVGPSPLLAEVPVCYSPPLLAGFCCRWWWAVPATPGWGPLTAVVCGVWCVGGVPRHSWRRFLCATPRQSWLGFAPGGGGRSPPLLAGVRWRLCCVVCGVWRWCVGGLVAGVWCGWSLATPGGGSCVLLPATPGWVSLPVVVGGPRHSWLGSVGGVAVWCVVCGGGVLVGLWLVCGVVGPSPLLAEVPVCYSPPLLAGFRCRWRWAVPATPGWGPLAALVCGVWCVVCDVWRWCVGGVLAGVWCGWSLATLGGGSCVLLPATPG